MSFADEFLYASACLNYSDDCENLIRKHSSGENVVHYVSVDVGQSEVAALMTVGHPFMIDAELIQDRRVQVVNVDWVFDDVVTEVVGLSVDSPAFDSGSCHPLCVASRMVVATVV